jgi:two-component system cell cycle sensor histidine kinase/response regulator CckA
MGQPIRVLLVEDDPDDAEMVLHALRRAGFDPEWHRVDTEPEYLAWLHSDPDVILSDHAMPQFDGPRALHLLKESGLEVPFISVSGTIGEEVAVEAMRHGVSDYLLKNNLTRLGAAVGRVLEQSRLRKERRQLEEQFRQAQKLEAVGQLAGGVAHDFNNILTVIQGYATLLEQGAIENVECAREITFAVERAAGLSRQLLSLTRKQAMQPILLDLNTVVGDMTKLLSRSIGEDITLLVEAGENLPMVRADQGMLEQVLLNLALNARDAMPTGGRLLISTSTSTISPEESPKTPDRTPGSAVCLRVADTGCGIAPEISARIFEPFFTTKALNKGTGLGLSTVQGIVKQHFGAIRVQSALGEGTTFEIVLPASKPHAEAVTREQPSEPAPGGHETILLVDDEPTLRTMMRMALKHFGYTVLEASSGKQALALFEQADRPIDLLLTDMVMPDGISGQELAEQMCAQRPKLRILYTSGYHIDLVSRDLAGQEGICFLQKPFSMQKLAKAVRDCLGGGPEPGN